MTLIYQNFNWLSLDRTLEPSSLLDSALDKIVESIEDEYDYWILLKQNLQINSLKTETKNGCTVQPQNLYNRKFPRRHRFAGTGRNKYFNNPTLNDRRQ